MVAARPAIKVLLVGGGPQEQALRAQVERMGLNERVVFTGRVPNAQIDRYYSLIDVLAYPRHRIRLTDLVTPLKPLEAMAQGRLLVASDIGGHRELIEHGRTGMLFAPDDATSLAQAVLRLLGDPELQRALIAQGRAFVETQRNWPASVARYDAVYARLLAGRDPVPAATGS
jgi:glycosyltransferase involved in cell wall biosynthesis